MFRHNLTLFTLYGFRVRINVSWIFLALLIVWSLAQGFFPMQYPGRGEALYWTLGLIGAFGLFFSLLFHEMSHSLIARWRGMKMGGITLFLFGGVAEMTDEPPTPRIEFEVAIAGPLASIFLAIVFHILGTAVAGALGMSVNEALSNPWLGVLGYLALINLILARLAVAQAGRYRLGNAYRVARGAGVRHAADRSGRLLDDLDRIHGRLVVGADRGLHHFHRPAILYAGADAPELQRPSRRRFYRRNGGQRVARYHA